MEIKAMAANVKKLINSRLEEHLRYLFELLSGCLWPFSQIVILMQLRSHLYNF